MRLIRPRLHCPLATGFTNLDFRAIFISAIRAIGGPNSVASFAAFVCG